MNGYISLKYYLFFNHEKRQYQISSSGLRAACATNVLESSRVFFREKQPTRMNTCRNALQGRKPFLVTDSTPGGVVAAIVEQVRWWRPIGVSRITVMKTFSRPSKSRKPAGTYLSTNMATLSFEQPCLPTYYLPPISYILTPPLLLFTPIPTSNDSLTLPEHRLLAFVTSFNPKVDQFWLAN